MKKTFPAVIAALALLLCGCNDYKEEVPETVGTTSETTEKVTVSPYILARGWEGRELLDSIYYCGMYRPLPLKLEDNPDLSYSDITLTFPDGGSAEAFADENGYIYTLRLQKGSAPADFKVYGLGFDAKPDDILKTVGAANLVYGDMDSEITYHFLEGGISELTFVFKNRVLTEVYIAA